MIHGIQVLKQSIEFIKHNKGGVDRAYRYPPCLYSQMSISSRKGVNMIKLDSYDVVPSRNDDFKCVKFIDNGGYKIEFTIRQDKTVDVEIDGALSLEDVKRAIEIVESGEVMIKL
jgi:hypothetical protein